MLKTYYNLAKPGIVYGNILTTLAAFLYASRWHIDVSLFLATIIGLSLVIASACVFNNFIDRDIDAKMARTRSRGTVSGAIPGQNALLYGTILGFIGFVLLLLGTNALTFLVALAGFLVYVFPYTFSKRTTSFATEIGSVSGAAPIVAGYTAVTGTLDWTTLILFLILALWQMPHFYAIAIYRSHDYAAAGIPVLPLKKGMRAAKLRIVWYALAFLLAACALAVCGYAGYVYLFGMVIVSIYWLQGILRGFKTDDDVAWGKGVFFRSLIVLLLFSALLSVALIVP